MQIATADFIELQKLFVTILKDVYFNIVASFFSCKERDKYIFSESVKYSSSSKILCVKMFLLSLYLAYISTHHIQ